MNLGLHVILCRPYMFYLLGKIDAYKTACRVATGWKKGHDEIYALMRSNAQELGLKLSEFFNDEYNRRAVGLKVRGDVEADGCGIGCSDALNPGGSGSNPVAAAEASNDKAGKPTDIRITISNGPGHAGHCIG